MARPRRIEGAAETTERILAAARCNIWRASLLHHFPSGKPITQHEEAQQTVLTRITVCNSLPRSDLELDL